MQKKKLLILITLVLAAALQLINISGAGFAKTVFSHLDDLHPPTKGQPSHIQSNKGNTDFVIVVSVFSIVFYIYLIVGQAANKRISRGFDWLVYLLVVCFQFAIVVTFGNFITNNRVRFETAGKSLDDLRAALASLPPGVAVPDSTPYSNIFVLKSLCLAAIVLTFFFCVVGSLFVFYQQTMNAQSSTHKDLAQKSELTEGAQIV